MEQNLGFAGGYNEALRQTDAEIYCLLNSDVRVTPGWIDPIFPLFANDPQLAAIQPKILSDRDPSRFEHAGAAGGFIDRYGYPFCRGRIMNEIESDLGQYNRSTPIFWASGACMFIRAALFHQAGGFDARYFAHMEEIDLCWRLKNQGYRLMYEPSITVYHWGGATLEYNNPRKLYLNFRNSLWTLYKNYTGKRFCLILFRRTIIDTFALVKYVLSLDLKNAKAVLVAHLDYYQSRPILRKMREEEMKKTTGLEHPEMLKGSIVWSFFIKRKKTFTELRSFRSFDQDHSR